MEEALLVVGIVTAAFAGGFYAAHRERTSEGLDKIAKFCAVASLSLVSVSYSPPVAGTFTYNANTGFGLRPPSRPPGLWTTWFRPMLEEQARDFIWFWIACGVVALVLRIRRRRAPRAKP